MQQPVVRYPSIIGVSSSLSGGGGDYGLNVTFTAQVNPSPWVASPSGETITFMDGAVTMGTGTLNSSGAATLQTSTLAVGVHTITAIYGGDANFVGSTSPGLTQWIGQDPTTTSVYAPVSASLGQVVNIWATVGNATNADIPDWESLQFYDGSTFLGEVPLTATYVDFQTSSLGLGTHSITAVFPGDGNFETSTSTVFPLTVNKIPTTTSISSSANPSSLGQTVNLTATVTSLTGAAIPPGDVVTFKDGSTVLGVYNLSAGAATYQFSPLAAGNHSITAMFPGDSTFAANTSTVFTQTVNQATTTTSVT